MEGLHLLRFTHFPTDKTRDLLELWLIKALGRIKTYPINRHKQTNSPRNSS